MKKVSFLLLLIYISCAPKVSYTGERNQDGKYHGKGTLFYPNGDKWEGEFKDGLPFNGKGTYNYPDKSKFSGKWKDGLPSGRGTFIHPEGFTYKSNFTGKNIDDIKYFLISGSGTRYVGIIKRGTKESGFGVFVVVSEESPDDKNRFGTKYEGEFKDKTMNGQGTLTIPDWGKYVGEFKDGKRHGQGTSTLLSGEKYVGEFKDDERHGQGTLILPSGQKYVGELKNNLPYGKGVLFKVNGGILSGTWINNSFKDVWTIEAVDNYLRNKYSQFKGLNYSTPTASIPLKRNDDILLPPPPDNPTFIAVVDFTGNNVSEGDCRALTDRLRAELFNTKYFKVIEREMMEQIIEEQGFQQSGCSTDECMVEVGKLVGVEQIVGGSISKVGNVYSISARIVNVETGEIENTGLYDHTGNIGELLTGGMKKVAVELIK